MANSNEVNIFKKIFIDDPEGARRWRGFSQWLTGISEGRTSSFKDLIDNIKNIAALVALSAVFKLFVDCNRILTPIQQYFLYVAAIGVLMLIVGLLVQSAAIISLWPTHKNKIEKLSAVIFIIFSYSTLFLGVIISINYSRQVSC